MRNLRSWGWSIFPLCATGGLTVSEEGVNLFEDACKRVFEKADIPTLIREIVNANRKSRRAELLTYLRFLHQTALREIQDVHIERGAEPERAEKMDFPSPLRHVQRQFALMAQVDNDKFNKAIFEVSTQVLEGMFLRHKFNFRTSPETMTETQRHNRDFICFDFPEAYLQKLETLLYPQWYVATFSKDFQNSSMWGHYADNHKGVCLIFEPEIVDNANNITLNRLENASSPGETWRPSRSKFYDVSYGDKFTEIDFFRSLGRVPQPELKEVWYRDQEGNLSECGAHLECDTEAWRERYWEHFYPTLSVKSNDWEYERETRLVLFSLLGDLDKRSRKLTYNFDSLKGIIFGIRTSDSDKQEVIEIIRKKCRENNRSDFKFFQARYDHKTGSVQKFELDPNFSKV